MNKLARIYQNAFSLLATVCLPTRKALISISSAVDPLSSDCIEIVRTIQGADPALPVTLIIHVEAANLHIQRSGRTIIVKKGSMRSIFYALTSRVSIVTHGLRDIGPFVNLKTVVINVWHGAPIKKIGYHSKATLGRERLKNISRAWDYLVVPSAAWVTLFSEAFGLSEERLLSIGYPRYNSVPPRLAQRGERQFVKVAYLPTYRAGISSFAVYDFLRDPAFIRFLDANEVEFKVRFHPADRACEEGIPAALLCPKEATTEQLIAQCDLLVTDCSSVIVDAAAIGIDTSLYFPDFAQVEECLGGFYHDFPGKDFHDGGAELSMEHIISQFLRSGAGNYYLPPRLIPRRDFSESFLSILPAIQERSAVALPSLWSR